MYRYSPLALNFQQKSAFSASALDLLETHQCSHSAPTVFSFFIGWLTGNICFLLGLHLNNIAKMKVGEKDLLELLLALSSSAELVSHWNHVVFDHSCILYPLLQHVCWTININYWRFFSRTTVYIIKKVSFTAFFHDKVLCHFCFIINKRGVG